MADEEKMLRGRCGSCDHVWIIAYLPMEVSKVAALAKVAGCPNCFGERVSIATKGDPQ